MRILRAALESVPLLSVLLGIGLAVMLYAGLNDRGFGSRNLVEWVDFGPGLAFYGRGIAYTEPVLSEAQFSREKGMSIEIALVVSPPYEARFRFIAEISGGDEKTHIVIAQWKNEIIVMQGDDYSHSRREPRVSYRIRDDREALFLTVVSGPSGTTLFVDGDRVAQRAEFVLEMPGAFDPARMILGNSATGRKPWKGVIRGVAVYAYALTVKDVRLHVGTYQLDGSFTAFRNQNPHLLLPLFPEESDRASDRAAFETDLNFPRDKTFVVTDHFLFSPQEMRLGLHDPEDLLLNMAGFVPFGFVLAALLRRRFGRGAAFVLTSFSGMLLSLLIETRQAWMPSRTSSLLDLILNTAGTLVGAICLLLLFVQQAEHSSETAEAAAADSPTA